MEKYEKLVRDNIPQILDEKGIPYEQKIAEDAEYKVELVKKLSEEIREFSETPTTEELADVLEVVLALTQLPEYQDLEKVRMKKREEKGGFDKRIILKGEK